MPDGVAITAGAGTNIATESFDTGTRQAGSHRQEFVGVIAGAAAAPTTVNVTTSSTTILAANALRVAAYFDNKSDTDVWIGLGTNTAVALSGIRIPANGGKLTIGPEWQGAVTGIHNGTGSKAVAIQELSV